MGRPGNAASAASSVVGIARRVRDPPAEKGPAVSNRECPTPDDHEHDLLTVYMAGHQHGQDADAGWRARALTAEKDLAEAERLLQRGYEDGDWKRVGAFLARHNKKNPE